MTQNRLPFLVKNKIANIVLNDDTNYLTNTLFCEVNSDTMFTCTQKMYIFFKNHPLSIHIFGDQIRAFDVFYNIQETWVQKYQTFRYFFKIITFLTKGNPDYYYDQLQIPNSMPNKAINFMTNHPDSYFYNFDNVKKPLFDEVKLSSNTLDWYTYILSVEKDKQNIEVDQSLFALIVSKLLYLIKLTFLLPYTHVTFSSLEFMTVLFDYYKKIIPDKKARDEVFYLYKPLTEAIEDYISFSLHSKKENPTSFKKSVKFVKEAFKEYFKLVNSIKDIETTKLAVWKKLIPIYSAQKIYMDKVFELRNFYNKQANNFREYDTLSNLEKELLGVQEDSDVSSNSDVSMD